MRRGIGDVLAERIDQGQQGRQPWSWLGFGSCCPPEQSRGTVLGEDGRAIGPVERFLAYLGDIERSPNTVRAYAHDPRDYWSFLDYRGLDWREVRLEDVGEFVAWLRVPPSARDGRVVLLPTAQAHAGAATVNRKLSAVAAFYLYGGGDVWWFWGLRTDRSGWRAYAAARVSARAARIAVACP